LPLSLPDPYIVKGEPGKTFADGEGTQRDLDALAAAVPGLVPVCHVYRSANFAVGNATLTTVPFDAEIEDPLNMHSAGIVTVPTAGLYFAIAAWSWPNAAGGRRILDLIRSNTFDRTAYRNEVQTVPDAATFPTQQVSGVFRMVAGDNLRLTVYHTQGGTLTYNVGGANGPDTAKLSVYRIGS
jgi:hypothetical protein